MPPFRWEYNTQSHFLDVTENLHKVKRYQIIPFTYKAHSLQTPLII